MKDEIYVIELRDHGRKKDIPCYTCAHCSKVVMLDPLRARPRLNCSKCRRLICETSELCRIDCTPIHKLADDGFMDMGKYGTLLPAILGGETTIQGAIDRKLLFKSDLP